MYRVPVLPSVHRLSVSSIARQRRFVSPSDIRNMATVALKDINTIYDLPNNPILSKLQSSLATIKTDMPDNGETLDLKAQKGKVLLIVNTASACGFTPQYDGLEALYKQMKSAYPSDDFRILGFPCNQFGGQEPGSDAEIKEFCTLRRPVTFDLMRKVDVNGNDANELWEWMKTKQSGLLGLTRVKWNFEKFLIGRDGTVKRRWASTTKPESIVDAVKAELDVKLPATATARSGSLVATPTASSASPVVARPTTS